MSDAEDNEASFDEEQFHDEDETVDTADTNVDESGVSPKARQSQILKLKLQPDQHILEQAIKLASDKNVRLSKLSETIIKDPVLTLDILANANSLSQEKTSIAAVQTAVIRIGATQLQEQLRNFRERINQKADPDVMIEFSSLRRLGERASKVAVVLSSHLQKEVIETAQTCALLSYIGPMILCQHLDREYLKITHLRKRNGLAYKLQSQYGINYNETFLRYLKDRNLPPSIFHAFDKDLVCKTTAQSALRLIVESAIEIVEAFEDGKSSRYSPASSLPPKSKVRMLKIPDEQYTLIFEDIERSLGILKPKVEVGETGYESTDEDTTSESFELSKSQKAIVSKLASFNDAVAEEAPISTLSLPLDDEARNAPTVIVDRSDLMDLISSTGSAVFIERSNDNLEYEKRSLSKESKAIIEMIEFICKGAESSKSLLEELMSVVTSQGPFTRAALIQISESRESALIQSATGENFSEISAPAELFVDDPLSPLSTCATRVSSFNSYTTNGIKDLIAPFGISSYAISPIKLKSSYTFVLYVDCGEHKPLPLEARKIFRIIVALLNQSLPAFSSNGQRAVPAN